MKRLLPLAAIITLVIGPIAGCGAAKDGLNSTTHAAKAASKTALSVFYAGSMTNVMEKRIRPDVDKALSLHFEGEGKGSAALAQMIKSHLANPDIFISASPTIDTTDLMGAKNHQLVTWFLTLAQDQLVIAYSPKSRFQSQLHEAALGQTPWYQVLQEKGFRLGRTDPALDPKGADSILMARLAATYYRVPNLETKLFGSDENANQVFPEEDLLAQLTSGQLDAVIAYKHEAVEWGVPFISLPKQINLGDVKMAKAYAKVQWTPKEGQPHIGAPIVFTIAIPSDAKHSQEAAAFVKYMISGNGHRLLMKDGFTPIPTELEGQRSQVPTSLQKLIQGTFS